MIQENGPDDPTLDVVSIEMLPLYVASAGLGAPHVLIPLLLHTQRKDHAHQQQRAQLAADFRQGLTCQYALSRQARGPVSSWWIASLRISLRIVE